jgi:hypothetical protein
MLVETSAIPENLGRTDTPEMFAAASRFGGHQMRLVKLSTDEFANERDVLDYFDRELPSRTPPGLFRFRRQIAEDGLEPRETILFSYRGHLRFVAQAETGRMDNVHMPHPDYPNCFVINMQALRRANVPLAELEERLRAEAGLDLSLRGQGWTRIPDSDRAAQVIEALL